MLFLRNIHNTSSAELYDAVCIAQSLGYNTAFKGTFFHAVPGILEKIFSSFHHKKAQANNIDRTGVTAWMIFFWRGGTVLNHFLFNLTERCPAVGFKEQTISVQHPGATCGSN